MQIEIITVGNEVLSGRTVDTNFAFLARALEAESVQVGWHSTVGDGGGRRRKARKVPLRIAPGRPYIPTSWDCAFSRLLSSPR